MVFSTIFIDVLTKSGSIYTGGSNPGGMTIVLGVSDVQLWFSEAYEPHKKFHHNKNTCKAIHLYDCIFYMEHLAVCFSMIHRGVKPH